MLLFDQMAGFKHHGAQLFRIHHRLVGAVAQIQAQQSHQAVHQQVDAPYRRVAQLE